MKRMVIIMIALILVTSVMTFAEEAISIFTYETALEAAVNNSNQPALDEFNIKSKESALNDAKEEAKKVIYGGTQQEVVERFIIKEVVPLEAETNLEIARKQKSDHERLLKSEVYIEMMRILLAQENVAFKKERTGLVKEKYDIDLVRFQEGIVSEADITDEDLSVSIENLELVKMETALKSDILTIKQKLNVDLSDENKIAFDYKLDKIGTHYTLKNFNLDAAIKDALAADTEVYQKQKAEQAAEKKLEITKQYLAPGNDYYDQKVYELEAAKKERYNTETNLEVSIRNAFNNLLTADDALALAQKKLDLENSRMSALKVKLDAGIISRRDMIDNEISMIVQNQQVYTAISDFNIKYEELKNLLRD